MPTVGSDSAFETFDNQFYPTPQSLGRKAFAKFKEKEISRLLEPQAGRGDLADVVKEVSGRHSSPDIECVEIDLANQAVLREKGYRVVGTDFFRYKGASVYSHILMNPPFRDGVKHVLHAWNLLFSGELVAILNAQDIRNANNAEQRQLVTLIADHGSVEFIEQAFRSEDTKRRTSVEIALIHLKKESAEYTSFIDNLRREVERKHEPAPPAASEVVVPRSFIENMVFNFECAVEAARQACIAQARATHFAARFDRSIVEDEAETNQPRLQYKADPFNKAYDELKERAWSTVLRSSAVLEKLSSQAQKRIEASFKEICLLEFTYENIWGFLDGLISQQRQIQQDMVCDVFDMFTKYHSENRAYYQGWKSNDKHRLNAFRIKGTRIVLPAARRDWYGSFSSSLAWDDEQQFRDFDKVFSMLDGKQPATTFGLCALFRSRWNELRVSTRKTSDYFDVRMYAKAGTFHLYPRRKDLIERINRIVGQARQWLPYEPTAAPEGFWQQYEKAEQIAAKAPKLQELARRAHSQWSESDRVKAQEQVEQVHLEALKALGINYDHSMLVEHEQSQAAQESQFPLLLDQRAA
jgi:hypothetical protein